MGRESCKSCRTKNHLKICRPITKIFRYRKISKTQMIKILNADNSFNKEAAYFLKEKILKLWPDMEEHQKDLLQIHWQTRTTSGKTEDIDLTILASFESPRASSLPGKNIKILR